MEIKEFRKIDIKNYGYPNSRDIFFIRVTYGNLSNTLKEILEELSDMSWLERFDKEFLRKSMKENATKTCVKLEEIFFKQEGPLIADAGEYIVSCLAKKAIVNSLKHRDIPLMELLGRKKVGNPGFDFYTEAEENMLLYCGEAKYVSNVNAYSSSLSQINDFINDKKHIGDICILNGHSNEESLTNLSDDKFGVCSAFSVTNIKTDKLIKNILKNSDFKKCLEYQDIVLVAVDVYEK